MYGFILENYDLRIMWGYRVVTVKEGIIVLNTSVNRYDICNEKAYKYFQSAGIWLLASTQQFECEEIFLRYRQRNEIEIMYRYFKNHVDADTLNVSTEHTFNAKLFIIPKTLSNFSRRVRLVNDLVH